MDWEIGKNERMDGWAWRLSERQSGVYAFSEIACRKRAMTTTTLSPPKVVKPTPQPKHWTCDEFHALWRHGSVRGQRDAHRRRDSEEGPINPPHATAVRNMWTPHAKQAFGAGWRFSDQLPLCSSSHGSLPDFAICAGSVEGSHPTTAELVIEVSDTSLDFDTDEKRLLYESRHSRILGGGHQRTTTSRLSRSSERDYPAPQILGPQIPSSPVGAAAR